MEVQHISTAVWAPDQREADIKALCYYPKTAWLSGWKSRRRESQEEGKRGNGVKEVREKGKEKKVRRETGEKKRIWIERGGDQRQPEERGKRRRRKRTSPGKATWIEIHMRGRRKNQGTGVWKDSRSEKR